MMMRFSYEEKKKEEGGVIDDPFLPKSRLSYDVKHVNSKILEFFMSLLYYVFKTKCTGFHWLRKSRHKQIRNIPSFPIYIGSHSHKQFNCTALWQSHTLSLAFQRQLNISILSMPASLLRQKMRLKAGLLARSQSPAFTLFNLART